MRRVGGYGWWLEDEVGWNEGVEWLDGGCGLDGLEKVGFHLSASASLLLHKPQSTQQRKLEPKTSSNLSPKLFFEANQQHQTSAQ